MRTQDFADYYSISVHKFLTTIIELGLITFLYDYHDDCNVIKTTRASMKQFLTTEYNRSYYLDIKFQSTYPHGVRLETVGTVVRILA